MFVKERGRPGHRDTPREDGHVTTGAETGGTCCVLRDACKAPAPDPEAAEKGLPGPPEAQALPTS